MIRCWQQRVGVGTSLRLSAEVSARAARLGARVKIGGSQQRLLIMAHVAGGAWQSCGEGSGAAQHEVEGVERRRRGECYKG
jgi:hypothetical protein